MSNLEAVAKAIQNQAEYNLTQEERDANFQKEKAYWMDVAKAAQEVMINDGITIGEFTIAPSPYSGEKIPRVTLFWGEECFCPEVKDLEAALKKFYKENF